MTRLQPWLKMPQFRELASKKWNQTDPRTEDSVQFSHSVMSDSLQPHGLQHARPPCPSPTPGVYSNSCPLSRWCHPAISSSVVPFSSCPQSFPASGSFQMSQFFTSGGQSIGVSALISVLPMNIQDWFPSGWTGWISLQSKSLLQHHSSKASIHQRSASFIVQLSHPLEWKLTFSSPVATAEFSKFAGILSAALSQHHLSGFEIAQLEFHHLH